MCMTNAESYHGSFEHDWWFNVVGKANIGFHARSTRLARRAVVVQWNVMGRRA